MINSVLHVCKVFLPVRGGVQRVVAQITQSVEKLNHTVLTTGVDGAIRSEKKYEAQIKRKYSPLEIASMPIAPSLAWYILTKSSQYGLIALHYPFPLAEAAIALNPFSPKIVIHWHSEIIAQRKLKWLVMPITFLLLLRAKKIVVTSQNMIDASSILKHFKSKLIVVPYGMPSINTENTNNQEDNFFLMVGRHVSYKGIDIAIRAISLGDQKLVVCGHGPLYEKHRKMARDLGVEEQITFKPYADDDEVVSLISRCRALLVPSTMDNEAFALVQLEAMRLGKPIINTSLNSSVPWVARHEREAITVAPGDAEALRDAMLKLTSDPALAEELGSNGLKRFNKKFTAELFTKRIGALYEAVLKED
ncbi:MAG: glycosyltransferase [Pseudomonadota bacterium]